MEHGLILTLLSAILVIAVLLRFQLKSEEKFREIVQLSNSIVLIMDQLGKVTFINPFACEFFGFRENEILGQSVIGTIVPPTETTGKDLENMIREIIESSEAYKINMNENMKKSGERAWIVWTNKAVSSGRKRHILCIGADMTKVKEAEDRLKELVEMKSRFVSMASHELRAPLAALKSNVELLSAGAMGSLTTEQQYWMDKMKSYLARLKKIADDILTVEKLDSGKMVFEMHENDLADTIGEVVTMMKDSTDEKKIALVAQPGPTPKLVFDRDRITQVLINLVNNATKFTDQGSITILSRLDGGFVRVEVTDTGCGMPAEEMPRLFGKFEQLKNAHERKAGGTGLGAFDRQGHRRTSRRLDRSPFETERRVHFLFYTPDERPSGPVGCHIG